MAQARFGFFSKALS